MIKFSEHAMHTGWNDVALYGELYQGLAEHIKDQLLSWDFPQTFQQLKADTLKCDTHYWECQGEKATPSVRIGSLPSPPHQQNQATT